MRQRLCLSVTALGVLISSGCISRQFSDTNSGVDAPTLKALSDEVIFKNSSSAPANLQQEVKRQLMAAVRYSGLLREFTGDNSDLILSEIGFAKSDTTGLDIDFSVDGRLKSKKTVVPDGTPESDSEPIAAGVATSYRLKNTLYNLSFAFQDRKTSEVFRFSLNEPLAIDDNLRITSRVKISFNAIKALPPQVGFIVARFLDDISLSLDSGVAWERASELSTRMHYRSREHGVTEFMYDVVNDVVQPLCYSFAQKQGKPTGICDVKLDPIDNPIAELAQPRKAMTCEKTEVREGLAPLYKLYVEVPKGAQVYRPGEKAFLYDGVKGGWKKRSWVTVVGEGAKEHCPGMENRESHCVALKYGVNWFDKACSEVSTGKTRLAVSPEDSWSILE